DGDRFGDACDKWPDQFNLIQNENEAAADRDVGSDGDAEPNVPVDGGDPNSADSSVSDDEPNQSAQETPQEVATTTALCPAMTTMLLTLTLVGVFSTAGRRRR
ncbi:MAG: hypothetical protein JXO22_12715, partial [Phycisphaerae bacterium]|nr:hypothetical protein [Phycisphaerae bacterium]